MTWQVGQVACSFFANSGLANAGAELNANIPAKQRAIDADLTNFIRGTSSSLVGDGAEPVKIYSTDENFANSTNDHPALGKKGVRYLCSCPNPASRSA